MPEHLLEGASERLLRVLYRDPRALSMWDEVYVRQNTGILAARGGHKEND